TSLSHLVITDASRRRNVSLTDDPPAAPRAAADVDDQFLAIWREELMHHAWMTLEAEEQRTGQPLFTVLRFRTDHPELSSSRAAEQLTARLDRVVSAEWVRKWLHQSRKRFASLLVDGVARSLADPTRDQIEQELLELGLLEYCREAMASY